MSEDLNHDLESDDPRETDALECSERQTAERSINDGPETRRIELAGRKSSFHVASLLKTIIASKLPQTMWCELLLPLLLLLHFLLLRSFCMPHIPTPLSVGLLFPLRNETSTNETSRQEVLRLLRVQMTLSAKMQAMQAPKTPLAQRRPTPYPQFGSTLRPFVPRPASESPDPLQLPSPTPVAKKKLTSRTPFTTPRVPWLQGAHACRSSGDEEEDALESMTNGDLTPSPLPYHLSDAQNRNDHAGYGNCSYAASESGTQCDRVLRSTEHHIPVESEQTLLYTPPSGVLKAIAKAEKHAALGEYGSGSEGDEESLGEEDEMEEDEDESSSASLNGNDPLGTQEEHRHRVVFRKINWNPVSKASDENSSDSEYFTAREFQSPEPSVSPKAVIVRTPIAPSTASASSKGFFKRFAKKKTPEQEPFKQTKVHIPTSGANSSRAIGKPRTHVLGQPIKTWKSTLKPSDMSGEPQSANAQKAAPAASASSFKKTARHSTAAQQSLKRRIPPSPSAELWKWFVPKKAASEDTPPSHKRRKILHDEDR